MKIILLCILAVGMIGLMVPSAFAEQIKNDFFKFQVEVPDEWTTKDIWIHLDGSWEVRGTGNVPSLEISSPDKQVRMIVTDNVGGLSHSGNTVHSFCDNNLEGDVYCDSFTIVESKKCPRNIDGCYHEVNLPYKIPDSPEVKTLKIIHWEIIRQYNPNTLSNFANTVFFVYDANEFEHFDHKSIMFNFKPYSEKPKPVSGKLSSYLPSQYDIGSVYETNVWERELYQSSGFERKGLTSGDLPTPKETSKIQFTASSGYMINFLNVWLMEFNSLESTKNYFNTIQNFMPMRNTFDITGNYAFNEGGFDCKKITLRYDPAYANEIMCHADKYLFYLQEQCRPGCDGLNPAYKSIINKMSTIDSISVLAEQSAIQDKIESEAKSESLKQEQENKDKIFGIPKSIEKNTVLGWSDNIYVKKLNLHESSNSNLIEIALEEKNFTKQTQEPTTGFILWDSEKREFQHVFSEIVTGVNKDTFMPIMEKDPNFPFDVDCSPYMGSKRVIQPGLSLETKFCFQIPKDSDHFILTEYASLNNWSTYTIATFDKDDASNSSPLAAFSQPAQTSTPTQESSSEGGGCLIATAAFGSEMAPQVQFLREIRDNTVMSTESGTTFMTGFNQFYYSFSPQIADYERENPVFKEAVKVTLTPLLTSLTLLNYVEIDSEEEMLGYGIGTILLNVGMYFVAPAVLIVSLKKRLFL